MQVTSLGTRTDLFIVRFEGQVTHEPSYVVVRSPGNPTHYWGNYVIFDRAPRPGDAPAWLDVFAREIGAPPEVRHVLLAWDAPVDGDADLSEFERLGFTVEKNVILAASADAVHAPPRVSDEAEFRVITTDEDWAQVLECQVASRPDGFEEGPYRAFKELAMAKYRRMSDAGLGAWFGLVLDGRVVADMGVYVDGTLGRYQAVGTHPAYRRRGLCGTLVWKAARYAREQWGVEQLVMIADEEYHAAAIYESVGFRPVEHRLALLRFPPGG